MRALRRRIRVMLGSEDAGMTTVEYVIGTLGAAALAVVLFKVVTGESVLSLLEGLIDRALSVPQ
ncbi:DUF4244 domain-containing protein [Kutzneria buriramensis]|uniref:Uncharacterized protein DUF4244 n=1 Tax=Kutzneria buriramensis TaxID=1045776 RepID=A0A3E0HVA8_9PSEU|nr:DUF4244 domain-containing protein [Kutzneria buriramensis]REH50186.1 uncharacterized protein DUF4244 [Kutzneria buriramensis]